MTPADLKAWRTARSWSQAKAAQELGISERSLLAYEKPDGAVPRVVVLAVAGFDNLAMPTAANGHAFLDGWHAHETGYGSQDGGMQKALAAWLNGWRPGQGAAA